MEQMNLMDFTEVNEIVANIVSDVRHTKQVTKKVAYDTGVKIGGARKDLAVYKEKAAKPKPTLTSKQFFGELSMDKLYERNVPYKAAKAIELFIKKIPKNNEAFSEEDYTAVCTFLFEELLLIQNMNHFYTFFSRILNMVHAVSLNDEILEKRIELACQFNRNGENCLILSGLSYLKTQSPLAQSLHAMPDLVALAAKRASKESFFKTVDKYRDWEEYFSEMKKKALVKAERTLPVNPTHESPLPIAEFPDPESFRLHFNFRAVEFGNSLKDEEGRLHIQHTAQSLVDLASLLGVEETKMSLGGELAMAFGSRGRGKALAHYERTANVINLTRKNGATGVLAHEWMHAFDSYLAKQFNLGDDLLFSEAYTDINNLSKIPFEMVKSYRTLVNAINRSLRPHKFTKNQSGYSNYTSIKESVQRLLNAGQTIEEISTGYLSKLLNSVHSQLSLERRPDSQIKFHTRLAARKMANSLIEVVREITGVELKGVTFLLNSQSEFYETSLSYDKGKEGKYFTKPQELLARCFEMYVESTLGWRNDYLVAGIDTDFYPVNQNERNAILSAMDTFIQEAKKYM